MIGRSARWMVNRLVVNRIINIEDIEIYQFGLESTLLKALHYVSMLIIGFCLNMLLETLAFQIVYAAIRAYAGGCLLYTSQVLKYISFCCQNGLLGKLD